MNDMSNFLNHDDDFEFIDFASTRGGDRTQSNYCMRLTRYPRIKDGKTKLSVRLSLSTKVFNVLKKKGLNGFRVRKDNVTGELLLIFLDYVEGKYGKVNYGGRNDNTAIIQNRKFVDFLVKEFKLNGVELHSHEIELSEDISNSDKYATFRIIKP
jgi:hypothetical protein